MSQTIPLSQGTLEERFAHILQPIRDLTKNWDVDIANYLEEYLEDLEKVEITFDDGRTTMNFSEAAMLIQGSAGVYAKKVEYLYSLVFQVLELVKQNKGKKSKDNENEGDDSQDNQPDNDDEEFLVLDDHVSSETCNGSYRKEVDSTHNKSVRTVPETPSRFVALQEAEKDDTALYNKKGDVLGNPCDFNIDMGYMTSNGSFLLEFGDKALFAMQTRQRQMLGAVGEENCAAGVNNNLPAGDNPDVPADDDENLFVGVDADYDLPEPISSKSPDKEKQKGNEPVRRSSRAKRVQFSAASKAEKQALRQDLLLDPYEKSKKTTEKPFMKKKPYKVPQTLEDGGGKAKKRKKKPIKRELRPIHEIVESLFSHRSKFPKSYFKLPEYPELEDAYWKEYKLREEDNKERIKKIKEQGMGDADNEKVDEEEEEPPGLDDLGKDDLDDVDDNPPLCLNDDDVLNNDRLNSDPCRVPSDTGFQTLSPDDMTVTYEDLVKMHVEKYLTSAAQYAQITDLSRRVSEWEEKIKPRLEEEQTHPTFDIHKYGSDVLEQMVRGQTYAFRDLVKGKSEYQICRYTLATLQLANVYNVELSIRPSESGSVMDSLYVTLLSTKRHFEQLEEYRAPSLDDK